MWRDGPTQLLGWLCLHGIPVGVPVGRAPALDREGVTIIQWIYEDQIEAYLSQGWAVSKMIGHHGNRKQGRNYMAVMEL